MSQIVKSIIFKLFTLDIIALILDITLIVVAY
jgi:hypothetical protein